MKFRAKVEVTLKEGVLDSQGRTILGGLRSLGYGDVEEVRTGKLLQLSLTAEDQAQAASQLEEMARRLLANPVLEKFTFVLEQA